MTKCFNYIISELFFANCMRYRIFQFQKTECLCAQAVKFSCIHDRRSRWHDYTFELLRSCILTYKSFLFYLDPITTLSLANPIVRETHRRTRRGEADGAAPSTVMFKCVGQMPQLPVILSNFNPPASFSMLSLTLVCGSVNSTEWEGKGRVREIQMFVVIYKYPLMV
jgi:hypothetical protein